MLYPPLHPIVIAANVVSVLGVAIGRVEHKKMRRPISVYVVALLQTRLDRLSLRQVMIEKCHLDKRRIARDFRIRIKCAE